MEAPTPNSGTIAAAAAPAGGALSILRLSGPDALKIALGFLRPRGKAELPPRRATLCDAVEPGGRAVPGALEKNASAPGTAGPAEHPIDEVVAIYYPGPNSATGEDLVEVSCHGSPYVVKRLLEAALSLGARTAEPGEFTRRAFLSGRMDLSQAEAVAQLIRAKSSGAHRAALFQLQGGLSAELARIREPILDALVRVEANLDHPEEDIPSLSAQELQAALAAPAKLIADLAATFARGRILAEGARVCLVGRPNAGKSSLLNALLGRERAIVSAAPGTTRDTLEEEVLISGAAAVLVDTAGLREEGGADEVEQAGMARTRAALSSCDLTVLVLDGGRAQTQDDERVRQEILGAAAHDGRPVVTVLNKSDLAGENPAVACDLRVS
ncbi:MAG: tRNA uridine-5-carboxymethylaminomethyl(34) synthesis GTPase MnmE, partial [Elusimicrobia bacterium]|nr:tRNA uridine-5-carboxymethylaminomethyl(34) synthesis GTPase MnmE [Elusimicrobiota bacterium]